MLTVRMTITGGYEANRFRHQKKNTAGMPLSTNLVILVLTFLQPLRMVPKFANKEIKSFNYMLQLKMYFSFIDFCIKQYPIFSHKQVVSLRLSLAVICLALVLFVVQTQWFFLAYRQASLLRRTIHLQG